MSTQEQMAEIGPVELDGFEVWDRTVNAPAGSEKKVAFVSVSKGGNIGMNRAARAMLPPCDALKVMYDPKRHRLGFIPADPEAADSFLLDPWCGAQLSCRKLFEYYGVEVSETRRFYDLKVVDGMLIANLGETADV